MGESLKSLFNSNKILKEELKQLKEQNEDHLTSINENTNEIQANYEYYVEFESKMDRIAERIDEISMMVGLQKNQKNPEIPKLTTVEKEVFLALYTLCEQQEYASYKDISKTVNLSETLVMHYITILIEKGVPIIKTYSNKKARLKMSSYFKTLQTKKDILRINEDLSQQIILDKFIPKTKN